LPEMTKAAGGGPRPAYKRRLSNFLLDKKLQLRYVLLVVTLSGLIAGTLGYLLYHQRGLANDSLANQFRDPELARAMREIGNTAVNEFENDDLWLVAKMIAAGLGLVVVLSAYLVIMTHKVAGPLYKVGLYFDKMADGKLGNVTPLRRGDMLQDFYVAFRDMHVAVRDRLVDDGHQMEAAVAELAATGKVDDATEAFAKHLDDRKKRLA